MRYEEYVIHGIKGDIGGCNIVEDHWGGGFKFDAIIEFPCGCRMYAGDLDIAQKNNWPNRIDRDEDFAFKLFCVCGEEVFSAPSAAGHQDLLGWAYIW